MNDKTQLLQETREHLNLMMGMERQSSEFLLASVVQDSLLYNLTHHAGSNDLGLLAREIAFIAVETGVQVMHANQFTVSESVRGVVHAMANLGASPQELVENVLEGALGALEGPHAWGRSPEYRTAIMIGIENALRDMGLNEVEDYLAPHSQAQ